MPIHYEQDDDHIVLITIDRPEARNSADMEHFKAAPRGVGALRRRRRRVGRDHHRRRRRVLHRRRPQDLHPRDHQVPEADRRGGARPRSTATASTTARRRCCATSTLCKPIVAAVNGFCTAGGMEMLGGVDIRVACPEAKFAVMEPKRGLFAGGGTTVRLPRQIPWPQAMEFLLCADLIPARARLRDGVAQRGRPARAAARHRVRVRSPHHRERAARGAGHEAERAPGPVPRRERDQAHPQGGASAAPGPRDPRARRPRGREGCDHVPRRTCSTDLGKELRTAFEDESKLSSLDLPDRGRQGGPEGVRREAPAELAGEVGDARRSTPGRRASSASGSRPGTPTRSVTTGAPEPLEMWEQRRARRRRRQRRRCTVRSKRSTRSTSCTARRGSTTTSGAARRAPRRDRRRARYYSGIGGTTPQVLVQDAAARILAGESRPRARACGAEALATQRAYKKRGERYPYLFKPAEKRPFPWEAPFHPSEVAHEVLQAWLTFAIFDNARRAHLGIGLPEYRRALGRDAGADDRRSRPRTPTRGSRVARTSTRSSRRGPTTAWSATRTRSTWSRSWTSTWPPLSLMTSHERRRRARRAGRATRVPAGLVLRDRSRRTSPSTPRCGARRRWRRRAARRSAVAGIGVDDVAHLDLYSCFGSSRELRRATRSGSRDDDPRPLTVTGGLPYHGGAGSNYMTPLDRDDGRTCCAPTPARYGLVSGVGHAHDQARLRRLLDRARARWRRPTQARGPGWRSTPHPQPERSSSVHDGDADRRRLLAWSTVATASRSGPCSCATWATGGRAYANVTDDDMRSCRAEASRARRRARCA